MAKSVVPVKKLTFPFTLMGAAVELVQERKGTEQKSAWYQAILGGRMHQMSRE
jgi:hypothetical protein